MREALHHALVDGQGVKLVSLYEPGIKLLDSSRHEQFGVAACCWFSSPPLPLFRCTWASLVGHDCSVVLGY